MSPDIYQMCPDIYWMCPDIYQMFHLSNDSPNVWDNCQIYPLAHLCSDFQACFAQKKKKKFYGWFLSFPDQLYFGVNIELRYQFNIGRWWTYQSTRVKISTSSPAATGPNSTPSPPRQHRYLYLYPYLYLYLYLWFRLNPLPSPSTQVTICLPVILL